MNDPRSLLPKLRRVLWVVCALLAVWLVTRFRPFRVAGDPAVVPMRFEPGQTLLLDLRPRAPHIGDAWLVRTESGQLALGIVQDLRDGALGMGFGRAVDPAPTWIWVPIAHAEARVLMALPF